MTITFLSYEHIIELHAQAIRRDGGSAGLRDEGLLRSALAQPMASFGGAYLHGSLYEMAASYLYSLVSNHAFIDGNKRVGLLAAGVFLNLNGYSISREHTQALYELTMRVARGESTKEEISTLLHAWSSPLV